MIYYGGACKALDDKGKVGGYLVMFGSPDQTDASNLRDYFTAETDFDLASVGGKSRCLYHHGLDRTLGNKKLGTGPADLKAMDVGIWMEEQLDLRDKYEAKLFELVKAGKMGLSSGTVNHLIRRQKQPNGSNKIIAWPLGLDASITPAPAEPRTHAVAMKTLILDAAKSSLLGEMAEPAAAMAAVQSLHSRLHEKTWGHLGDEKSLPVERMKRIGNAYDECKDLSMKCMKALMGGDTDEDDSDAGAKKALGREASVNLAEDLRLLDQIGATLARTTGLEL
jgi:phage head maturation protease